LRFIILGEKAIEVLIGFADFSLTMDPWNFVVLETHPSELNNLLFDDIFETYMPKIVRLVV